MFLPDAFTGNFRRARFPPDCDGTRASAPGAHAEAHDRPALAARVDTRYGQWPTAMSSQRMHDMNPASKYLGSVCVLLTVILWAITLTTDTTPSSIAAAGALTGIVGLMIALSLLG